MKKLIFIMLYFVSSYSFLNGMDKKQKIVEINRTFSKKLAEHKRSCEKCQLICTDDEYLRVRFCDVAQSLGLDRLNQIAEIDPYRSYDPDDGMWG